MDSGNKPKSSSNHPEDHADEAVHVQAGPGEGDARIGHIWGCHSRGEVGHLLGIGVEKTPIGLLYVLHSSLESLEL